MGKRTVLSVPQSFYFDFFREDGKQVILIKTFNDFMCMKCGMLQLTHFARNKRPETDKLIIDEYHTTECPYSSPSDTTERVDG